LSTAAEVANVRYGCYNAALDLTFFFGEGVCHRNYKLGSDYVERDSSFPCCS